MSSKAQKSQIRTSFLEKRLQLSSSEVFGHSKRICDCLSVNQQVQQAKSIIGYQTTKNEIDLTNCYRNCLELGKTLYFPRYLNDKNTYVFGKISDIDQDFIAGKYDILEPKPICDTITILQVQNSIDVWLVPGLAFDRQGNRIGFGKGYYDSFLKDASGYKIGIAYPWQVLDSCPSSAQDMKLDYVMY